MSVRIRPPQPNLAAIVLEFLRPIAKTVKRKKLLTLTNYFKYMAQRRMFSPQIIDSDAFLDMPSSAQSLYFHLGMRADDDGFVGNPRKILRIIGGSEDDLKILFAKKFVLTFESGIIVIKHWRINNLIRKDWYKETAYLEEKSLLIVKENGAYSLSKGEILVNELGNEIATEPPRRLGKVSLGKDINIPFENFWKLYPKKVAKKKAEQKWDNLTKENQELILVDLPKRVKCDQWQKGYILDPTTYLNGERWLDEIVKGPEPKFGAAQLPAMPDPAETAYQARKTATIKACGKCDKGYVKVPGTNTMAVCECVRNLK